MTERVEILLDLTGMEGVSLLLMSYGSGLSPTVPGSSYILWEGSSLSGIDFPVLRIRVTAPTPDPVTSIPTTLGAAQPYDEAFATGTRTKTLTGNGMVGMGMFMINGAMYDIDVINDTIQLGSMEVWTFQNNSNMAHPMLIHGGSFFILDRNASAPPVWESGAKDVVLVDVGEAVRVIMRFDELSDGWPFMYHCHNLMHEDNRMMAQYIVVDPSTATQPVDAAALVAVFPSPTASTVDYHVPFIADELLLMDRSGGGIVLHRDGLRTGTGIIDMTELSAGVYMLTLRSRV